MESLKTSLKNLKIFKKPENKQEKILLIQQILAVIVCAILLGTFVFCYINYGAKLYNIFCEPEQLKNYLKKFHNYDKLIFVFIRAFQTVIKIIPAEPLEIGSGVLYGTWGGLLYCVLGTEIGSLIIILLTKIFGRKLVNLFVPVEKIDSLKFLSNESHIYYTLFIIYLIPGTPKDIITYVASLTNKISIVKFLIITGFARLPSIITSTWCGDEIINHNYVKAIVIFVATAVIGFGSGFIYKKFTDKHSSKE